MTSLATVRSVDSPVEIDLDPATGLPVRLTLSDGDGQLVRAFSISVSIETGGTEDRGWTGGLQYLDTRTETVSASGGAAARTHRGTFDEVAVPIEFAGVPGRVMYRLFPTSPYVEVALELTPGESIVVRNVRATVTLHDQGVATVNAPGNGLRPDVPVADLTGTTVGVSPLGGLRGSSGIVALTDEHGTTTVWPTQRSEIPDIVVSAGEDGSVTMDVATNFAAALDGENAAEVTLVTLDVQRARFDAVRAQWPRWAQRYGLGSPDRKPEWVDAAQIYEVQIGTSYFWGGNTYTRYGAIAEVTADLERISRLGFSVIQLMPKQPYPSYNVHDYGDITTSYGDEEELRALVRAAHDRGIRVILDVLLHGVVDQESVNAALDGIARGPLADRLEDEPGDTLGTDVSDSTSYLIAWSRHIHDFADAWRGGSPARTPLEDEHPEWFFRDSNGQVTGVYTKAFDARNREWQRYFRESMLHLVRELDIDGFRFDAPTYNHFPNWSESTRGRASLSALGCVPLFEELREDIRSAKADALMYTEPSGHLLRASMDLNYNYDEQWLVSALADPAARTRHGVRTAREFMLWMRDRDLFLPEGSKTAHHIDSHDTFWWPHWGGKWRREQFGIEATRMLAVTFLALDGPFMMFTGGEEGIHDELALFGSLRARRPDLWASPAAFDVESDPSGDLFILRRGGDDGIVVIANATGTTDVALPEAYARGWSPLTLSGISEEALAPGEYRVLSRVGES
ncbi:alpha-amylase family glycosyl hydrolase [Microbacterium sp. BK668]|uniref:alpha-amylase family glycosyl hydrolase n=1 Tax=Microbacterium sp. BK668 TaxID=2512118 RepID=UPI0010CEB7A3|nr:alpha-amylase family glycosyl hydrolase [Microbacterium sp. BK668]TDN91567.1 alpha amylase catalytic subunit [Microbacterium sp. BK668]